MTTTSIALRTIRKTLESWTSAPRHLEPFRQHVLSRLNMFYQPILVGSVMVNINESEQVEQKTLTCPACGFVGLINDEEQHGKYGHGFRYLEDVVNRRDVAAINEAGVIEIEGHYELGEGYDDGINARLECRNCLGEFAIPEELELDFT